MIIIITTCIRNCVNYPIYYSRDIISWIHLLMNTILYLEKCLMTLSKKENPQLFTIANVYIGGKRIYEGIDWNQLEVIA